MTYGVYTVTDELAGTKCVPFVCPEASLIRVVRNTVQNMTSSAEAEDKFIDQMGVWDEESGKMLIWDENQRKVDLLKEWSRAHG